MTTFEIGSQAPEFALPDQNGEIRKLSEYAGKMLLIYFYPKDDTPGCTTEACSIRDNYVWFEENGVQVVGVSKDSPESHLKFAAKYELPFTLLSDKDRSMIDEYGAGGIMMKRISYLIDKDGVILKCYENVDPTVHAEEIMKDITNFNGKSSTS